MAAYKKELEEWIAQQKTAVEEMPEGTEEEKEAKKKAQEGLSKHLPKEKKTPSKKRKAEEEEEEEEEYDVECITDRRETKKGIEYLVKWKGWAEDDNTWEPAANLENSQDMITKFEKASRGESIVMEGVKRRVSQFTATDHEKLMEAFGEVIKSARSNKGCAQFDLLQGEADDNKTTYQLVEAWKEDAQMEEFDKSDKS